MSKTFAVSMYSTGCEQQADRWSAEPNFRSRFIRPHWIRIWFAWASAVHPLVDGRTLRELVGGVRGRRSARRPRGPRVYTPQAPAIKGKSPIRIVLELEFRCVEGSLDGPAPCFQGPQ